MQLDRTQLALKALARRVNASSADAGVSVKVTRKPRFMRSTRSARQRRTATAKSKKKVEPVQTRGKKKTIHETLKAANNVCCELCQSIFPVSPHSSCLSCTVLPFFTGKDGALSAVRVDQRTQPLDFCKCKSCERHSSLLLFGPLH